MKKFFLLTLISFTFLASNAQHKKSKKSKKVNREAIAQSKFKKQEASKKLLRDSVLINMRLEDSTRLAMDSVADFQKDSMSVAYTTTGLATIDSTTKAQYATITNDRMSQDAEEQSQRSIIAGANLSQTQWKQVKLINTTYTEKAKVIQQGEDEMQKNQALITLNTERRAKLKALLGKSKERKLEKERLSYSKKKGADKTTAWMNIQESVVKK
jgi:hypothetical protein